MLKLFMGLENLAAADRGWLSPVMILPKIPWDNSAILDHFELHSRSALGTKT